MPAQALIIDEPWIGHLIAGRKTWEMRSRPTTKRGRIALVRKGSGAVVATATIIDCLPPLSAADMPVHFARHRVPQDMVEREGYRWFTPWVLADVRPLAQPLPYRHPSGAVTWVDLAPEVQTRLQLLDGKPVERSAPGLEGGARPYLLAHAPAPSALARPEASDSGGIRIELTAGNITHKHFYWRAVRHLLPADAIGGSNEALAGVPITVAFAQGDVVESDIAGDKMILRDRAAVRRFFEREDAREGDSVVLRRTGERCFAVALARRTD